MTQAEGREYDAEMRFGIVMYGGVSLAIYIYGVANELFELACATPLDPAGVPPVEAPDGGTREIYRRLAVLAGNASLRQRYAEAIARGGEAWNPAWHEEDATRFAVDVIAGTSAGGINGLFLAKALAKGQRMDSLGRLWVDEGDLGRLINDAKAYGDLTIEPPAEPASLLASDRMFLKLLEAFDGMAEGRGDAATSPLVEELDVFVTTTDIQGTPVALRLFDKVVLERRHKQRLHFSYPSDAAREVPFGHDFASARHPFLAFAARCTSSFPFAFEPMTLTRLRTLCPGIGQAQLDEWRGHFAEGRKPEDGRAFGDGGYLQNKPFSYVAEALSQRFGDAPVQRKLLYVEPDPERLAADEAQQGVPDALANAMAALFVIPQYQTIREDLQAILQRNRRIERVERIVQLSELEAERRATGFSRVNCARGELRSWHSLTLEDMAAYYGDGFLPYRRLRVYAVTDWLAEQVGAAHGIDPHSDHAYALRAVVRAWRERHYEDNPAAGSARETVNAFLVRHDYDYRLRRMAFLLRRIDALTRLLAGRSVGSTELQDILRKKLERHLGFDVKAAGPALPLLLIDELKRLKHELRQRWRLLLQRRRLWRRGMAVQKAGDPGDEFRRELDQVLALLLDTNPGVPRGSVRDVDGRWVPLPAALHWNHPDEGPRRLQDTVYERVLEWLSLSATTRPLAVWNWLGRSIEATRLDEGQGTDPDVFRWLEDDWERLGRPRLEAHEVPKPRDDAPLQWQAALVVDTPVRRADGQAFASADERRAVLNVMRLLGEYYLSFDWYDQTRFTLYYDTSTGEPATVDVVRVSPADAPSLRRDAPGRQTLAGVKVAHFGAFLDAHWRRNDIMWGRLDGAERLIGSVLPGSDADTVSVRAELLRLAQQRILAQTLRTEQGSQLTGHLLEALRETPGRSLAERGRRLRQALCPADPALPATEARLRQLLDMMLSPEQLLLYARLQPTFDPEPPPVPTMDNASRVITVTGRLLQAVSREKAPAAKPLMRWVARLGLLLQGTLSVAVPGTLAQLWWSTRLMPLVYTFEGLLLLLALLLGSADLRTVTLTTFAATLVVHVLVLLLRDHITAGRGGRVLLGVGLVLALAVPAGFGGLALWRDGWVKTACGAPVAGEKAPCAWVR